MAAKSKKTLNLKNLTALGAERLAEIALAEAQRSTAFKRELRLLLAGQEGAESVAKDVRRRLTSLGRARADVEWNKTKDLARDLDQQRQAIAGGIAPTRPDLALELLWRLLELGPATLERCDDYYGAIEVVFEAVVVDLGAVAQLVPQDPKALADKLFDHILDDDSGIFGELLAALHPSLGTLGAQHLGQSLEKLAAAEAVRREGRDGSKTWVSHRAHKVARYQRILADLDGDVDSFIALFTASDRTAPRVAAAIANRLVAAGRPEEAWAFLEKAETDRGDMEFGDAQIDALTALGRTAEAQDVRWRLFCEALSTSHLRDYLKKLPDFDDLEAEEKALSYAAGYPNLEDALAFLIGWPALDRAAALVLARADEIDGNNFYDLAPAAQALAETAPLSAAILLRTMIWDTLQGGKSKRYPYAARDLMTLKRLDLEIESYGQFENHVAFVIWLQKKHGRKHGFWSLAKAQTQTQTQT